MSYLGPVWDNALWDISPWALGAQPPGGSGGWGDDWEWWIEYRTTNAASSQVAQDITANVVEARWSTDSHAMGDGTFRGDLQPGKLTLRCWDPTGSIDGRTYFTFATIWALYKPLGACWCWWIDDFTRPLMPRGDPGYSDLVITADSLGPPLTNPYPSPNPVRPAETVNARLAWIVGDINYQSGRGMFNSPPWELVAAVQNQTVKASTLDNLSLAPGYLPLIRDAASDGVAWLSPYRPGDLGTLGRMRLRYERWETVTRRAMPPGMITAGPPIAQQLSPMTRVSFTSTEPDGSTHDWANVVNAYYRGGTGPTGLRVYAQTWSPNPDLTPLVNTMLAMVTVPSNTYWISSVESDAGVRRHADGSPSTDYWDPTAHVWSPIDVMTFQHPVQTSATITARVVSTDHRLSATVWQSAHTLELFVAPSPLSA